MALDKLTKIQKIGINTTTIPTVGGVEGVGVITATTFIGDGSGLTGVTASGSGVIVKDGGTLVGTAQTIDFGTNLNISPVSAGIVTVTNAVSATSLNNLSDVTVSSASNGQILKHNGSAFVNTAERTYSQSSVASGSNVNLRLSDGSINDDILITAGSNITFSSVSANGFTIESSGGGGGGGGGGSLDNVVEDLTPQLGGNLDFNNKFITGSGGINVSGVITATTLQLTGNQTIDGDIDVDGHTELDNVNVSGAITATTFTGNLSGNSATATEATNFTVTANNSTNETVYPVFVDGATGTQGAETDTGLSYNPNSGNLTSTKFTGNVTGDVTGNLIGNVSSSSGNVVIDPATQIIEIKGDGSSIEGQIQLNCHVNSHGQKITAADHSVAASNTLTLPGGSTIGNADATLVSDTGTQTLTNKTLTSPTITGTGAIAGTFTGDLTGNVSGNAGTATSLATARNIGGVSFDGSAAINLPGVNIAGNQNTSGNAGTATSLATARNIGGVSFDGTANIDLPGVNAVGNQDTSGNAGTATSLATARNIGGVSFDGSADINLPGVNAAGNQDTSGTATNATNITVADESSDTTCFPLFATAASGNLGAKSGTNLTFNSSSGALTAGSFVKSGGTSSGFLKADGSVDTNTYVTGSVGINNIVEDTTPQLGGNLDLNNKNITGTGNVQIVGVITATSAVKTWTLGANGIDHYTFIGDGFQTATDDPILYLERGHRYAFLNNSGGSHPFQIRVSNGGSAYSTGVTNNGASSGYITFNVPWDAPSKLYYQCTSHGNMGNTIYIHGAGGNNENLGVTTFTGAVTATSFSGSGANLTGLTASQIPTLNQNTTGNAATADKVDTIKKDDLSTGHLTFVADNNTNATAETVFTATGITVDSSTDKITATTFVGALTGNSATATKLAAAVNIGGVSFDGSAAINLPGVNAAGNQNTSGTAGGLTGSPDITVGDAVVTGDLTVQGTTTSQNAEDTTITGILTATSVEIGIPGTGEGTGIGATFNTTGADITGIVTATSFKKVGGTSSQFLKADGSVDTSTYLTSETSHSDVLVDGDFASQGFMVRGASAGSYSIDSNTYVTTTGNAATASKLAAAVNVGGVSFDGSAAIDLPGVNTGGNQDTSGTAGGLSGTPNITVAKVTASSLTGFDYLQAPHGSTTTFTVTVATKDSTHRYNATGSPSGYKIDGVFAPFLTLTPGRTYRFDVSDSSNGSHPLRFYLDVDKVYPYTTGVTVSGTQGNANAYVEIVVSDTTPTVLHYQCSAHVKMGNAVQVNSNVVDTPSGGTVRGSLTATSFVKDGGASSQFLKADGSVDTNTYLTSETSHADVVVDGDFSSAGFMKRNASAGSYSVVSQISVSDIDIDAGTDIGANLADADLFIVDDGAGGTNRKTAASRIKSYVHGFGSHSFTAPSTATITDSTAVASCNAIEYTIFVSNSSNIQSQKVLIMDDGTNAYIQEYAVMSNPNLIVTFTADINSGNVRLKATPVSGISGPTTIKFSKMIIE